MLLFSLKSIQSFFTCFETKHHKTKKTVWNIYNACNVSEISQAVLHVSDVWFQHLVITELVCCFYLHPEEGDAREKVHRWLEVTEACLVAGWKVVLRTNTKRSFIILSFQFTQLSIYHCITDHKQTVIINLKRQKHTIQTKTIWKTCCDPRINLRDRKNKHHLSSCKDNIFLIGGNKEVKCLKKMANSYHPFFWNEEK